MRRIFIKIKRRKRRAMLFMAFFTFVNAIFQIIMVDGRHPVESAVAMFVSFPILAFLLALLPALIPIKKLSYLRRWLTITYLVLFILHCIMLSGYTIIALGRILNYLSHHQ